MITLFPSFSFRTDLFNVAFGTTRHTTRVKCKDWLSPAIHVLQRVMERARHTDRLRQAPFDDARSQLAYLGRYLLIGVTAWDVRPISRTHRASFSLARTIHAMPRTSASRSSKTRPFRCSFFPDATVETSGNPDHATVSYSLPCAPHYFVSMHESAWFRCKSKSVSGRSMHAL